MTFPSFLASASPARLGLTVRLLLAFVALMWAGRLRAQPFVHPGCLSTQADLDRMADKVAANEQPWKSGFERLVNNGYSHLEHTPSPQATVYVSSSAGGDNYIYLARDAASAYQAALRYHVTGDANYADKAVSTLMAWANTHTAWSGDTNVSLRAGLYGYQLACAGELVRNHSGWAPADFAKFQNYVRTMFYRYVSPNDIDRGFLFHHHGTCWSHYWANWELAGMATVIATGVLCDDETIFNEAIDYFHNGVGVGRIGEMLHHLHPNGLGQSQEFGRDQGHATMLVPLLGAFCEIAWNQGVDLYGELDNALLALSENLAKHNLYYEVPYVTYVNCEYVIQTNIGSGQGQMRPGWELIYNHYANRRGISAPYSREAAETMRPEGGGGDYGGNSGGFDQLGFTTLTHSLSPIATLSPPSQLRPHVKGGKITLSWRGSTYARSYNVKRATTSGGPYVKLATVDAKNTYYIDCGATPGTTYRYVVSADNPGGESVDSAEVSAAHDGQLYGTLIGTDGSWDNRGARKEHLFDGSLKNFFDAPTSVAWAGLDLGEGVSAVITGVKYCPRDGQATRMVGGKFQGSNTADFSSGVVDLFTIAAAPANGVLSAQGVTEGTSFRYVRYLCPANGYGNAAEIQFIGNVTGMSAPASAPSGLVLSSPGSRQITVTWNAVPSATEYRIKRATTGGGPYTVVDHTVLATSYTDRALAAGTYFYVVTALNSVGESANSAEQSLQLLVNVAPGSTTSASSGGGSGTEGSDKAVDGNVGTKWYSGGNTGSSGWLRVDLGAGNARAVLRYDLTSANDVQARDPKDWRLQASHDGINWTTLDTRTGEVFATRFLTQRYDIANDTAYRYYKLDILSNYGGSASVGIQLTEWTLMSTQDKNPASLPAAPQNFAATPGGSQITLSWDAVPGALGYTLRRSAASGGPYSDLAAGILATTYTDSGLPDGTRWYYTLVAFGSSGAGASSGPVFATPYTAREKWRLDHFGTTNGSGNAADLADPDGDALVNLLEYALGGDPLVFDIVGKPVAAPDESGHLTLSFARIADPVLLYEIQASDDLATWATFWSSTGVENTAGPVTVTDPELFEAHSRRFLRLSVTLPPE